MKILGKIEELEDIKVWHKPQKLVKIFRIESHIDEPNKTNFSFMTNISKGFIIQTSAELWIKKYFLNTLLKRILNFQTF